MEHRYGERINLNLKANIFKRGLLVGKGIIRNASQYGLYLQTDYVDVNPLQRLMVDVVVHSAPQQSVHYKLKTMVIHQEARGLGLELIGEKDALVMAELVKSRHLPARGADQLTGAVVGA